MVLVGVCCVRCAVCGLGVLPCPVPCLALSGCVWLCRVCLRRCASVGVCSGLGCRRPVAPCAASTSSRSRLLLLFLLPAASLVVPRSCPSVVTSAAAAAAADAAVRAPSGAAKVAGFQAPPRTVTHTHSLRGSPPPARLGSVMPVSHMCAGVNAVWVSCVSLLPSVLGACVGSAILCRPIPSPLVLVLPCASLCGCVRLL